MSAARRWVAVAAVVVAAGCGTPSGGGSTTTTEPSTTSSTSVATSTTSPWSEQACRVERMTIETANEAYMADTGAYADSIERLVEVQFLKGNFEFEWSYESDGETFTLTGPC